MASSAAKVDETTLRQQDDVSPVGHKIAVDLGLDVLSGLGVSLEPGDVDLDIEMTNVCLAVSLRSTKR